MSEAPRRLSAGEFFGRQEARVSFACAEVSFLGDVPHIDLHEHDHAHFVLVLRGAFDTDARRDDEPASAQTPIITPAGTRHADALRAGGLLMTVTPRAELTRTLQPKDDHSRVLNAEAGHRLTEIAGEARDPDALSGFAIEAACLELLALTRAAEQSGKPPPWIARAKARLRDASSDDMTIASLAAECGVHPVYFARAFRRHAGCAPGDYQRRARAARAADLLAHTHRSLAEIALACGFSDQAAFSKSFARAAGRSPGAFRRDWTA